MSMTAEEVKERLCHISTRLHFPLLPSAVKWEMLSSLLLLVQDWQSQETRLLGNGIAWSLIYNVMMLVWQKWCPNKALLPYQAMLHYTLPHPKKSIGKSWVRCCSWFRMDSHGRFVSSSSPTGPNRECQNREKASSTLSAKCTKRKSSLAKTDLSPSTVGKEADVVLLWDLEEPATGTDHDVSN